MTTAPATGETKPGDVKPGDPAPPPPVVAEDPEPATVEYDSKWHHGLIYGIAELSGRDLSGEAQLQDLLKIKQSLGIPDPRHGLRECELCDNEEWRPGVTCAISPKAEPAVGFDPEAEAAVQAITDQIMAKLK